MKRTTRAGFLIALWGIALTFFGNNGIITVIAGVAWFIAGAYLFLKEE